MKKILNVGIAGYGTVGKIRHRVIEEHPNLKVIAICDQIFKKPETLQNGARCWSNYKELLKEDIDILFVCLPNYLAPEVTVAGLKKGLHVFCEKPPGKNLEDMIMVRDIEKKFTKQKLMYGFNHRYHDSVQDALKIIRSGELGDIIDMRGVYGKSKIITYKSGWRAERKYAGGGILLDQGIHMVDLMRYFAGEFYEVHSYISNRYWNHDVEDNAYALMKGEKGVIAFLHSSATQWRHRFQLDITLTRGAIILSGILTSTKSYGAETITIVYAGENDFGDPREEMRKYNEDHSWRDEVFEFADAILNNRPLKSGTSEDAYKTMKLVYKIYWSDPEWRELYNIRLPEEI